jgi:Spy/CpxP family protein refolding chaperone
MKRILILAAVFAFAIVPFTFADPPPQEGGHGGPDMGGPGMMMDQSVMKFMDDMKLTEDQKDKLREIHGENKRDIISLRHEIELAVFDMQEEYKKEKSDPAKINSCIDKIADAQKKMMKIRSAQMLKMKAILTPEQFKTLAKKMDKAKQRIKVGFFQKLTQKEK